MFDKEKRPKACVGVMVFKDGKVLIGKRRGRHGDGEYSFPGGSLEYMQSFSVCVKEEVSEEAGIEIKNIKFLSVANIRDHYERQDILLSFSADWESGEPRDFREERIGDWQWCDLNRLPQPLFYPTEVLIDSYKTGKNYYDKE